MSGSDSGGYYFGNMTANYGAMWMDTTDFAGTENVIHLEFQKKIANGPVNITVYYTDNDDCSSFSETCKQDFNGIITTDGAPDETIYLTMTDAEWDAGDTIDDLRFDFHGGSDYSENPDIYINSIEVGAWTNSDPAANFANAFEIDSVTSDNQTMSYTNTNIGTEYTSTAQVASTNWTASTWYTVIFEMLSHSIVGRVYNETTGALVETFMYGKDTYAEMDTEDQWLSTNTYLTFSVISSGSTADVEFDDVGMGGRKMPDVMPWYFKDCGYQHDFVHVTSDGDLYSGMDTKIYKSTNDCTSASELYDFSTASLPALLANLDNYGAEDGAYIMLDNAHSETANVTFWKSPDYAFQYDYSSKMTLGTTADADNYGNLGAWDGTNGLTPGDEHTFCAWVYVPSGQGITLSNVWLRIIDYDGSNWETVASNTPSATDAWEQLCATKTTQGDAHTHFMGKLYLQQDLDDVSIYWDEAQWADGDTESPVVLWDDTVADGIGTFMWGLYKSGSRLIVGMNLLPALFISDDDGTSWTAVKVPFAGTKYEHSVINHWTLDA